MEYKSNNNVFYSCKYHVIWCPKYRRPVLVDGVEVRLKELIETTCASLNVEIIELKIMPDHVHHADDRDYRCKCGYHTHRDLWGAVNICASTEYVGDSTIRHTA